MHGATYTIRCVVHVCQDGCLFVFENLVLVHRTPMCFQNADPDLNAQWHSRTGETIESWNLKVEH